MGGERPGVSGGVSGAVKRADTWAYCKAEGDTGGGRGLGGGQGEGECGDNHSRRGGEPKGARGAYRGLVKCQGDIKGPPLLLPLRVVSVFGVVALVSLRL